MDFQKLISESIASVKVLLVLHNAKRVQFRVLLFNRFIVLFCGIYGVNLCFSVL